MYNAFTRSAGYALLVFRESVRSFQKNNNLDEAASLAYYGFFAFIPLFFIVISIFNVEVATSRILVVGVEKMAGRIIPQFGKVMIEEAYFLTKHREAIGIFGFIALFWSITPLVNAIRRVFATIFMIDRKVSFLKSVTLDIAAASLVVLLFAALLTSELFFDAIAETTMKDNILGLTAINYVAPPVVTFLAMLFIFPIFSPVRLRVRHMIFASGFTAVFWTLIKEIFARLLIVNPHYGYTYGSLKAIFIVVMWSYFSFLVMLFSLELLANMRNRDVLLLKKVFTGAPISKKTRRDLRDKFIRTYNSGEEIFREGDAGDSMFYILEGSVAVSRTGDSTLVIKEGQYFGELSMFLEEPRADKAVALEAATQVVVISRENFYMIVRNNPAIIFRILRDMAASLRRGD